jgi:hypothetical protein
MRLLLALNLFLFFFFFPLLLWTKWYPKYSGTDQKRRIIKHNPLRMHHSELLGDFQLVS